MTRILALETSSDACSVALLSCAAAAGELPGGAQVASRHQHAQRDHTHLILPMVDELLASHGWSPRQLDAIAVGSGPGSFTGLRIAAGVAQGLAFAAELPVVAVSSLAAMAHAAVVEQEPGRDCRAIVCLDARMGELYTGVYDGVAASASAPTTVLTTVCPEQLLAPANWHAAQWQRPGAQHLALGAGWACIDPLPAGVGFSWALLDTAAQPHAVDVAWLGLQRWRQGETLLPHQVEPHYLRDQVAWPKVVRKDG